MEHTFDQIDVDGNGKIDYLEFLVGAANETMLYTKRNLRKTFDAFDKSNTGTITKQDLKELCKGEEEKRFISKRDVRKLMKEADLDGDGEIDFQEFCEMMMRQQH